MIGQDKRRFKRAVDPLSLERSSPRFCLRTPGEGKEVRRPRESTISGRRSARIMVREKIARGSTTTYLQRDRKDTERAKSARRERAYGYSAKSQSDIRFPGRRGEKTCYRKEGRQPGRER